jgi:hypothetical protein
LDVDVVVADRDGGDDLEAGDCGENGLPDAVRELADDGVCTLCRRDDLLGWNNCDVKRIRAIGPSLT